MENKLLNLENGSIEIEGVELTKKALDYLREEQENDNEHLQGCIDSLAEAVCFIGSKLYILDTDEEIRAAAEAIEKICYVRERLSSIEKPFEIIQTQKIINHV